MLPGGYDPKYHDGKIWWNENNPGMREIWGTQESYDKHIQQGGTWDSYVELVRLQAIMKKEPQENMSDKPKSR